MKPLQPFKTLLTHKPFHLFLFSLLLLVACTKIDLYEKIVPVPGQAWQSGFKPTFTFEISDTTAPYQLFLILRHNNQYSYNNIWVAVHRKSPDGKVSTVPYELQLAANEKGWLAEGMDDLYTHRIPLTPPANDTFYFNRSGAYTFTVEQTMREDPLPHMMNVGLRIEKKR